MPPEKKYQHNDGGPGVGQIGELFRLRTPSQDSHALARDFLALMTLNVAMVNTDAHAKNYSLILRGDTVRLAPAYNVLSIALYADRDEMRNPLAFRMRVGDSFHIRSINPLTLAAEGTRLGLAADESREIVDGVLSAVPAALELARRDVADVPGGRVVADTIIANLRAISPLYPRDGVIRLTGGPIRDYAKSRQAGTEVEPS